MSAKTRQGFGPGVKGVLSMAQTVPAPRTQALANVAEAAQPPHAAAGLLQALLAASGDCIKLLDLDGNLLFMSEGGRRAMEVSDINAVLGCPWSDFWQDSSNSHALTALATARAGGTGTFRGQADTFAGTPRWWEVQVSPLLDLDGRPERLLVISRDITAAQRAEQALLEARGLNTPFLNSSRDCIVVLDLEGRTRFVSAGGIESMEIADVEAILGLSWLRVWRGVDQEAAQAAVAAARAGGFGHFQGFCPTHAGRPKWWDVMISPLLDLDGKPDRLVSVGRDITTSKQAEIQQAFLLRVTDRLRVQSDPRAIMATTVEMLGAHLGANRVGYGEVQEDGETIALETSYANGTAPLSGMHRLESFGAAYLARHRQGLTVSCDDVAADPGEDAASWAAIDTRAFVSVPLVRDGRFSASLYVNFRAPRAWQPDELALIENVAVRTWDTVERARAEEALREAKETLEQRVAAALAEQANVEDELRQAQKMEAVGQLTGGLAHDFNNLLTGITGSLELLETRLAQGRLDDVKRYIDAAQGASRRAAALTHRLLAFSRRQTLEPKSINANRLIAGMEELVRQTVGPAVVVEVAPANGLWNTLVDPNQLENALLNLCINARDAMPGGGRLTIETGNKSLDARAARDHDLPPGQYVSLCDSDSGTGMSAEVIARAFDPFFTTKPLGEGTGLGLSMIYGFVRQSGGLARIYSEPGQGSMVCLYLPRHLGADDSADEPVERVAPPLAAQPGQTVLVVDDEPTVRMLVAEVLESLGYIAIEASDGAAGLKVLQSDARLDLLITDVGLPGGLNGRQVADAGRRMRPGLKVLFITGYAETAVLSHGHLDPGMHVLTKPFAIDRLAKRIKELI